MSFPDGGKETTSRERTRRDDEMSGRAVVENSLPFGPGTSTPAEARGHRRSGLGDAGGDCGLELVRGGLGHGTRHPNRSRRCHLSSEPLGRGPVARVRLPCPGPGRWATTSPPFSLLETSVWSLEPPCLRDKGVVFYF